MSKSDASDNSRINLTDEPEVIFDKIKKAKTDSIIKVDLPTTTTPEYAQRNDFLSTRNSGVAATSNEERQALRYHNPQLT